MNLFQIMKNEKGQCSRINSNIFKDCILQKYRHLLSYLWNTTVIIVHQIHIEMIQLINRNNHRNWGRREGIHPCKFRFDQQFRKTIKIADCCIIFDPSDNESNATFPYANLNKSFPETGMQLSGAIIENVIWMLSRRFFRRPAFMEPGTMHNKSCESMRVSRLSKSTVSIVGTYRHRQWKSDEIVSTLLPDFAHNKRKRRR